MFLSARFITAFTALAVASPAMSQDHPLIGHLEGATPAGYQENEYDETNITHISQVRR